MEIQDLEQVTPVYAALLCAHVKLMKILLPRVSWKETPVIVVFEQNTYVNALADVKGAMEQSLVYSGVKLRFYNKWSKINNKYMLGKHVSPKIKLEMVLATVSAILKDTLCYYDTIMSVGWAILAELTKRKSVQVRLGQGTSYSKSCWRQRTRCNQANVSAFSAFDCDNVHTGNVELSMERLTDKMHAEQGKLLLGKLREEMAMVTITKSPKGTSLVSTGGKRSVEGRYTRDDMLSAVLLLCHTRDEIHAGDASVQIHGEPYYK